MPGGSPRFGPRRRGYMRAGGYTSTRGEASRDGGGCEGFFCGALLLFFSFFVLW